MAKKDEKRNVKPPTRLAVDISKNGKPQMRYWVFQEALTFDENGVPLTWIPYYKTCNCCGVTFHDRNREEAMSQSGDINENFYQSFDSIQDFNGYMSICKDCLFSMCDDSDGVINQKKLIKALMRYNKVYNHKKYENLFKKKESSKNYFSSLSSLAGQREKGFLESDKEAFEILIEMAKEENSKLDFNISQEDIDFIQESDEDFSKDIEQDSETDNESLLSNSKRRKLIKKWGNKDDNDLIYLDDKFNEICANYKFSESTRSKYEDSIIELCDWLLASRNSTEVSDKKIISDSIDKLTKSLGMQRKDDKEADSGLSIGEVLAVAEKHEGFVSFGKYKKKYNVNQDLIDKTLTILINVSRQSMNNGAKLIKSLYDLLDDKDEYLNPKNIDVKDHLDEVDLDVSDFNLDYEEILEREEAFYKDNNNVEEIE